MISYQIRKGVRESTDSRTPSFSLKLKKYVVAIARYKIQLFIKKIKCFFFIF